ncbi:hypothetical protein [Aedoeadaptatus coxii]|uniref:hypothetical protein n=1 Tax=Aedoeadaptatus coxii TaxID=755172 RepID=UPI002AD49DA1|nr:hypothetical protein [Peptoniphilus coxii]
MVERYKLERYYTFTKVFYFIWFVLPVLVIGSMFKDIYVGHIDLRNIVFQIFCAIILVIVGSAFRYLNFLLKDIIQGDTFSFLYLYKIHSLVKTTMAVVFLYGCIGYEGGGVGLERIDLSPNMILSLACLAFLLIVFDLFFVYQDMVQDK